MRRQCSGGALAQAPLCSVHAGPTRSSCASASYHAIGPLGKAVFRCEGAVLPRSWCYLHRLSSYHAAIMLAIVPSTLAEFAPCFTWNISAALNQVRNLWLERCHPQLRRTCREPDAIRRARFSPSSSAAGSSSSRADRPGPFLLLDFQLRQHQSGRDQLLLAARDMILGRPLVDQHGDVAAMRAELRRAVSAIPTPIRGQSASSNDRVGIPAALMRERDGLVQEARRQFAASGAAMRSR